MSSVWQKLVNALRQTADDAAGFLLRPSQHDRSASRRQVEWPTLALTLAIYTQWFVVTWLLRDSTWLAHALVGGVLLTWHGSIRHETVHGHPTPWPWLNHLLGGLPLGLSQPYGVYRAMHLAHHAEPLADSTGDQAYNSAPSRLGQLARAFQRARATAVGHILLSPPASAAVFCYREINRVAEGDRSHIRFWVTHAIGIGVVMGWVLTVCEIPLWVYLTAYVYPAAVLGALRTFAQHQPHPDPDQRSLIVESRWLGWLYLYNNLHALHHAFPDLPWYQYPAVYRKQRRRFVQQVGRYWFPSYRSLLERYALHPKTRPARHVPAPPPPTIEFSQPHGLPRSNPSPARH